MLQPLRYLFNRLRHNFGVNTNHVSMNHHKDEKKMKYFEQRYNQLWARSYYNADRDALTCRYGDSENQKFLNSEKPIVVVPLPLCRTNYIHTII